MVQQKISVKEYYIEIGIDKKILALKCTECSFKSLIGMAYLQNLKSKYTRSPLHRAQNFNNLSTFIDPYLEFTCSLFHESILNVTRESSDDKSLQYKKALGSQELLFSIMSSLHHNWTVVWSCLSQVDDPAGTRPHCRM